MNSKIAVFSDDWDSRTQAQRLNDTRMAVRTTEVVGRRIGALADIEVQRCIYVDGVAV